MPVFKFKPRVLLDVDGVLCDFLNPALLTIKQCMQREDLRLEQMTTWHMFDSFGCNKEQQDWCYEQWKKPGWCRNLPVYPGAQAAVRELQKVADVYICTSPMNGPTWTNERERWLLSHFGIGRKNVIHTECKWICAGDFLIDDKTPTLEEWQRCNIGGIALRWKQVTNLTTPFDGLTLDSWPQLVDIVASHIPVRTRTWTT